MFNKYFELIKTLFETVFKSTGEAVQFKDYLYVLGFTFALIAVAVIAVVVLYYTGKLPFIVYEKVVRKIKEKITDVEKAISDQDYTKYSKETIGSTYDDLHKTLLKKRVLYILGVIFLYVPFVIPTILFVVSAIKSWF